MPILPDYMQPILEIQNVSKKYRIGQRESYLSLRDSLRNIFRFSGSREEDFWALNNVSFNVEAGESIGIIGRNGAGKSTLLKILSKITPPTEGRIIGRGRIASLLEVGTGFHPELTGRENIYFNGSLLGMKRKEIDRNFSDIVEFSGVEQFLDTPLKHYSSGMQLRLAFAVAAFLEPEVLIIDEVLAVGDAEFQKKCMGKMEDVSKSGRTILFVSHNLAAVENLCSKAILLDKGTVVTQGRVSDVIRAYQSSNIYQDPVYWEKTNVKNELAYFKSLRLELAGEQPAHILTLSAKITSQGHHAPAFIAFDIVNSLGTTVLQAIPEINPFIRPSDKSQEFVVQIELPPLIPDHYKVSAWIGPHNSETYSWDKEIVGFEINDSPTPGRNFPHSHHNGFLVPRSKIIHG